MGDFGNSIPRIYAALDNGKIDHQTSIIKMDDKICDQVVSIFIEPRSNYSYVNTDLASTVGYRYQEESSSSSKSLCI